MLSREEIIKKMFNSNGELSARFTKTNPEMHHQIMESFNIPDLDKLTAYYCWYHDIEPKLCPTCGKSLSVKSFVVGYHHIPYCSKTCWTEEFRVKHFVSIRDKIKKTNLEKFGVEHSLQNEEVRAKSKQSNIDRYGVEHPMHREEVKDKIKATNLERYGVEHPLQRKDIKEKVKKTNVERYGVEYPIYSDEVKAKLKQTNIERYGVENALQNEEVKAKLKQTNIERYGVEHPLHRKDIKEKVKKTNVERYGVENQTQRTEIKEKIRKNNLEKYGVEHISQSEEVKAKIKQTNVERYGVEYRSQRHLSPETIAIINSREEFKSLCEKHEYNTTLVGKELGTTHNTALNYMRKHELDIPPNIRSYLEQELVSFIESLGITNYVVNDRRILNGKEIDLYLPDHKVGIEMDGVYWHSLDEDSETNKKNHHRDKVLLAREKGIKLIQLFEDEWNDKRLICESIIKNALGLGNNKLYARKLSIKEIPSGMAKTFCDNNHLSGGLFSKINLGLFDGSILVQVATFSTNRFSKDKHWELIRLCSAKGYNIVGGASRLIKKFFEITDASELVSFSDNRVGQGNVYKTIGFKLVHETSPGYFWFVDGVRYHRIKYQKHKLTEMDGYSPDKTEDMIMFENGHRKIYDSGNRKWIKKNPSAG